jgi:hypothetical protein
MRWVLFSYFALLDPLSTVPRVIDLVFMFCAPGPVLAVPRALGPVFMFCAVGFVFDYTEGAEFCFLVPRASSLVFMFCAHRPIFGGSEGVRSSFHVLRFWTHYQRYREQSVQFSCFALPNSFPALPRASDQFSCFALPDSLSAVPRVPDPVFMFCAIGSVFGHIEGVKFRFHVLRSRTRFRWYRRRRVQFSCFVLPDPFSTVPRASNLVFMYRGRRT